MAIDTAMFQAWNFFIALFYTVAIIIVWVLLGIRNLTGVIIALALSTFILFMWAENLLALLAAVI